MNKCWLFCSSLLQGVRDVNGLLTEREWRKQYTKRKRQPDWYGPQYVLKQTAQCVLVQDRAFLLFLLVLSLTISVLLPLFVSPKQTWQFEQAALKTEPSKILARHVEEIKYTADYWGEWDEKTYTEFELLKGKMLLLDDRHPLPADMLPPNTYRIASYGNAMIPVEDLSIKSGKETIEALKEWFTVLRKKGISNLAVSGGTVSIAQQRAKLLTDFRAQMKGMPVQKALETVLDTSEWPGTGEMLREYSVDLRFRNPPTQGELEILFQTAWRHGFAKITCRFKDSQTLRFRYVGKAHAMAMTYLNLALEDYLLWLHEKEEMTVYEKGEPRYLILCKRMPGQRIKFFLPRDAEYDISADNMGYAVIACSLQ